VFDNFEAKSLPERNLIWLAFTQPAMQQLFVDWSGFAYWFIFELITAKA
jgi:hypothetical protein